MTECPMCQGDEDCGSLLHPEGKALPHVQREIAWEMSGVRVGVDYDAVSELLGVFSLPVASEELVRAQMTDADWIRICEELLHA